MSGDNRGLGVVFDLSCLGGEGFGPVRYLLSVARAWHELFPHDQLSVVAQTDQIAEQAALLGLDCTTRSNYVLNKLGLGAPTGADVTVVASPTLRTAIGPRGNRLLTCYDFRHVAQPERFSRGTRAFRSALWPRSFRRATGVICISEQTRQELQAITGRIDRVLALGVPPSATGVDPGKPDHGNREGILAICHRENKPPRRAIRLWKQAFPEPRRPPLTIIAGDLAFDVPNEPGLRVVDRLSDQAYHDALRESRVLLFPTDFEGLGVPIIEAQAAGTPVVTTELPTLRQLVGPDYELLPDPDSHDGDLLARLYNDPVYWAECRETLLAAGEVGERSARAGITALRALSPGRRGPDGLP